MLPDFTLVSAEARIVALLYVALGRIFLDLTWTAVSVGALVRALKHPLAVFFVLHSCLVNPLLITCVTSTLVFARNELTSFARLTFIIIALVSAVLLDFNGVELV